jgi:hypothetical protein
MYRAKADCFTVRRPSTKLPERSVPDQNNNEDRYSGPKTTASMAILFTMDLASTIGFWKNLLQANHTGITLKAPAEEKRTARSGSTLTGLDRNNCETTSAPPHRIKVDDARPKIGCLRNVGIINYE